MAFRGILENGAIWDGKTYDLNQQIQDNVFRITGNGHVIASSPLPLQKRCSLLAQRPLLRPANIFLVRPLPIPIFASNLELSDGMYTDFYLHFLGLTPSIHCLFFYLHIFTLNLEGLGFYLFCFFGFIFDRFCSYFNWVTRHGFRLTIFMGICLVSSCLLCSGAACTIEVLFVAFSDLSCPLSPIILHLQVRFFVVQLLDDIRWIYFSRI